MSTNATAEQFRGEVSRAAAPASPCDDGSVLVPRKAAALPQPSFESRLEEICDLIKRGVQPPRRTVRCILGWLDVARRSYHVNNTLENYLVAYGLKIIPEFAFANVDDEVAFVAVGQDWDDPGQEASYRIGQLEAANAPLVFVTLDSTLAQAVTLMMHGNYSQLPVMANSRDVKGVVSWRSIGKRLALKRRCDSVRECMEAAQIVTTEDSFFEALEIIAKHDYVLVRSRDKKISGILTASDFNGQFRNLAEPFLLLGEIEKGIRGILKGHFTVEQLKAARAPMTAENKKITGLADLTFGEYVRLLGTDEAWRKVDLHIDKAKFICWLDQVRTIRNNVMHFSPDGLDDDSLTQLQQFAEFLRCLRDAGAI